MPIEVFGRAALGLVWLAAALGKLADRDSARSTLQAFGLDRRLLGLVRTVPVLEITIAAALFSGTLARPAGAASLAMLLLFSGLVARSLLTGRQADCHCFGALHASRISWRLLVRNAAMVAASVAVAVMAPALSLPVGAAIAAVLAGTAGSLLVVLTARPVGRAAGEAAIAAKRTILLFVDPSCIACRSVVPALQASWRSPHNDGLLVVTRSPLDAEDHHFGDFPPSRVVVDEEGSLFERYAVSGTPAAVVLSGPDQNAEPLILGAPAVEQLLEGRVTRASRPTAIGSALRARFGRSPGRERPVRSLRTLSRREALALAGFGATVGLAASLLGNATDALANILAPRRGRAGSNGVTCPSSGTCTICEIVPAHGAHPAQLSCKPCAKKCSTAELCSQYANEYSDFTLLASYLRQNGFSQDEETKAVGLEQSGSLVLLGSITKFSNKAQGETAVLNYNLTNSGQSASAAVFAKGVITSVLAVNPAGNVIVLEIPAKPASSPSAATRAMGAPSERAETAKPSCQDVCEVEVGFMMVCLGPLMEASFFEDAAAAAWAFLNFFISEATKIGDDAPLVTKVLGKPAVVAMNAALGWNKSLEQKVQGKLLGYLKQQLCKSVCSIKLEACCNFSGACFNSDGVCERNCPSSLAHPVAECILYINGIKIGAF